MENKDRRIRVAIAEDHQILRQGIVALLEDEENLDLVFDIGNGIELIDKIKENPIDVLILDLNMPKMDGESCLPIISELYPNLKIVALLNPFDVHNPYNQSSSSLIFNDMYSKANLAIVHGFWKLEKPNRYNEFESINTIIRKEVLSIKPTFSKNKICCPRAYEAPIFLPLAAPVFSDC